MHHADRAGSRPGSSVQKSWPERSLVNGRPFGARCSSPLAVLDGRADRDELGQVGAPLVAADVQPHADDPVGAELVGLLLHARHRQLAGVVHRLGEHVHLLVLAPDRLLEADVVDRAARRPARAGRTPPASRAGTRRTERSEVKRPALFWARRLRRVLGDALERGRVVAHGGRLLVRRSGRWWVWRPGRPGRGDAGGQGVERVRDADQLVVCLVRALMLAPDGRDDAVGAERRRLGRERPSSTRWRAWYQVWVAPSISTFIHRPQLPVGIGWPQV